MDSAYSTTGNQFLQNHGSVFLQFCNAAINARNDEIPNMGHEQFYIAAVKAERPTHIAFEITAQGVRIISGPGKLEHVAGNVNAITEFQRDLPTNLRSIECAGGIFELEEIKSWHFIQFERMLRREQATLI